MPPDEKDFFPDLRYSGQLDVADRPVKIDAQRIAAVGAEVGGDETGESPAAWLFPVLLEANMLPASVARLARMHELGVAAIDQADAGARDAAASGVWITRTVMLPAVPRIGESVDVYDQRNLDTRGVRCGSQLLLEARLQGRRGETVDLAVHRSIEPPGWTWTTLHSKATASTSGCWSSRRSRQSIAAAISIR